MYNCSNGALMKTVHKSYGSTCVALHYYDEAKRFLAGFARGQVCIFDENVLEECILIRQFECYPDVKLDLEYKDPRISINKPAAVKPAAHADHNKSVHVKEMLSIEFDHTAHTVATAGATDGMLRIWDYDSSKCSAEIHVCNPTTSQIVHLKMLLPYPLIITSDSSGSIILWGSRKCKYMGQRISAFLNATPASASLEPKARHADENDTAPRRALPPETRTPLSILRAEADAARSLSVSDDEDTFGDEDFFADAQIPVNSPNFRDKTMSRKTKSNDAFYEASLLLAEKQYLDSEAKWGKCSAAHAMSWNAEKLLLITGDDLGNIRCYSLRDAMADLQKEQLLDYANMDHQSILGLCKNIDRDDSAALAPIDHDISSYLLARPNDAMSYLGARFMWGIYAHNDRIINCTCTPEGVLTSGADRLVKMWTYAGVPIGTLLQSVPIGTRSKTWDLVLDVKSIIEKENEELDAIIEQVSDLARTGEKPDIYSMDFTGMQLGEESANFSQSVLRQRIERTTKILGIDFPTSNKPSAQDDINSVDLNSISSAGGKSLADALQEIKSTDSGVDYEFKTKSMSYIQQRRKANKLEALSKQYEEKSGVRLNTASKEISIWEGEEQDNKKGVDFDKLLSSANSVNNNHDDGSVNDDLYSVDLIDERKQSNQMKHNAFKAASKSKIADSIKQAHERGARTISMLNSCKKYKAFDALDDAIQSNGASNLKNKLSDVQAADIRAARERKINRASIATSTFLMGARERKSATSTPASTLKVSTAAAILGSSTGSMASTPKADAARLRRRNSTDTEVTDDSSLKVSMRSIPIESVSPQNASRSRVDSPVDQDSLHGSQKSSPHTFRNSAEFQSTDEYTS